ncbi:MAG: chromophore lyase CpcT/CpeT [Bacteroidota bacterium]
MRQFPLLFLPLLFAFSCVSSRQSAANYADLTEKMTGSFDSKLQASTDDSYYEISLHMYPIWEDRPGTWLYIEQALYSNQDSPYRQRVYQVEQRSGRKFISRVFELPDPEAFIGAYRDPSNFDKLRAEDLIERDGCAVFLRWQKDGTFKGSTNEQDCSSSLRGATFATSKVTIGDGFIQSWDQGFNAEGEQVWGATEGGYMFFRQQR